MTLETLRSMDIFRGDSNRTIVPEIVDMNDLRAVHLDHYIGLVKTLSQRGGLLDSGDTPALPGLYEGALRAVGATVQGARDIIDGEYEHAFNPAGGLHHAHPGRASGFCVFHDIAVAVRMLQREYNVGRVAIIDTDGHHGDGTQDIFYAEDVLTISLHRYGRGFFPGTGEADEIGEREGRGFNINVPLPQGTDDDLFLRAYRSIVLPALRAYHPEMILHQFGVDGHYLDPLVGLGYTAQGYGLVASLTHDLAHELCDGRYLVVGGGGYDLDATRRAWSIMYCIISGSHRWDDDLLEELHDGFTPYSNQHVTGEVLEVIEDVEDRSLPLLEGVIRYV